MSAERHEKWKRVSPGHTIPARQPVRYEYDEAYTLAQEFSYSQPTEVVDGDTAFIDATWRPPLDLPTEPTWGIAIHKEWGPRVKRWVSTGQLLDDADRSGTTTMGHGNIVAFIPLTDEQIARIEAVR